MIVDTISPTPFALIRRGAHFEYGDEYGAMQSFSQYDDPVKALSDECIRVVKAISAENQTRQPFVSSSKDTSWSRFEDMGFGFSDKAFHESGLPNSHSQSNIGAYSDALTPGQLASVTTFHLDDAFWWVWMSSHAPEETSGRRLAFGRCVVVETKTFNGWIVMEELVKGEDKELEHDYVGTPRKKGFRNRPPADSIRSTSSGTNISPDQHARILAAALKIQAEQRHEQQLQSQVISRRGGINADVTAEQTVRVFDLQPVIMTEASPAMKWANSYDKEAIRAAYLHPNTAAPPHAPVG